MRALFALLIFTVAADAAASAADAATLRPVTTLHAPTVRLSDLFDGVGADGATVLGPAPPPGGRIVVEAAQLAAIARQFGVDWRPAGAERAVLERPGRLFPREDVLAALRAALAGLGAPEDGELDLPGYAAPLVPTESAARAEVEQMEYDAATGRFAATLSVAGDGMLSLRQRIAGTMHAMAELPVPTRRLAPGQVLRDGDIRIERVRLATVRGEVARDPAQLLGMALRRPAVPGRALALADLVRPVAVAKGARVAMQLAIGGLTVSGQGQALESGAVGERIQVLNPASRAVLEVEVIGPDRVRVAPGSAPVQPASQLFSQVSPR